jgi:hypothetical protein
MHAINHNYHTVFLKMIIIIVNIIAIIINIIAIIIIKNVVVVVVVIVAYEQAKPIKKKIAITII